MSTDKENPKNGDMEVEDASSEETPDTPESKSVPEVKDSEDSSGKTKEKDSVKKKQKGRDLKNDEDSNDGKEGKEEKEDSESDEDDEEDDNDDGKVPLLDQPLEMSGTRERKKVQRFTEEYKREAKDKAPIEIPEGKGMSLGSISKIEANIQKKKGDDLKPLHKILFNRFDKSTMIKKNIKKFNGFDFDEKSEQYMKKKQVLVKLETKVLRNVSSILDLKISLKREDLAEQLLKFLIKPEGTDKPVKQKRKRSGRPSKSHSDSEEEEKRPQSRRGKMKRVNLKEVSTDDEEFGDEKDEKEEKGSDEENDKATKKEKKRKVSSKDKENDKKVEDDEENVEDEDENDEDASSDDSEEPKSKRGKGNKSGKKNNKAPAKKANSKKPTPKKVEKKTAPKKRTKSDDEDDKSSDDEPINKKTKAPPTDEEIRSYVKHILEGANLEETTMKIVCKKVYAHYPDFDLAHKKDFIKTTVKSLIST